MLETFNKIIAAQIGISEIKELLFQIRTNPQIDILIQRFLYFIETLQPLVWAAILGAVALILSNFGKKLIAVPLIAAISGACYLAGSIYIAPRLSTMPLIGSFADPTICGISLAIIGAILFLPIYFVGYAGVIGYATYYFAYPLLNGMLGDSTGKIAALAVAVLVVILGFKFRKWVEIFATAVLGGYLAMWAVNVILPFSAVVNYVIWAAFALEGIVVQVKTRRRY